MTDNNAARMDSEHRIPRGLHRFGLCCCALRTHKMRSLLILIFLVWVLILFSVLLFISFTLTARPYCNCLFDHSLRYCIYVFLQDFSLIRNHPGAQSIAILYFRYLLSVLCGTNALTGHCVTLQCNYVFTSHQHFFHPLIIQSNI